MFRTPPNHHSLSTLFTRDLHAHTRDSGIVEFVGMNAPIGNGAVVLGSIRDAVHVPSPRARRFWSPVAWHLSAAIRLRAAAKGPGVTFRADGRLVNGAVDKTTHERLRDALLVRERARARKRSATLWPALIAGEWAFIDRFESGGRRHVVAHRVPAAAATLHVLTARERTILDAVTRGEANKAIAIDLGLSEATVSRALADGLRKLGCNAVELVDARRLEAQPIAVGSSRLALVSRPAMVELAQLTTSERAVLEHALRGVGVAAIARSRGRSARTITNQLRAIYEKLGVRSRRELLLRIDGK
jgi:DNA-binding NarL/FixJ family response regulator